MKKRYSFMVCLAVLGAFANCGKHEDSAKPPVEMSGQCLLTQRNNPTMGMNTMTWGQPTYPQYAANNGPCSYNYQMASAQGFAPAGMSTGMVSSFGGTMWGAGNGACYGNTVQVFSPSKGLGCVDTTNITISGQPVIYDLNQSTLNYSPISSPIPNFAAYQYQMQSQQGFGWTGSTFGNTWGGAGNTSIVPQGNTQAYRVCDTAEQCPNAQYCRSPRGPMSGAGPIGICYF